MTDLRHLQRYVNAKSTTVLLLHSDSIPPTSNNVDVFWRVKSDFPSIITRWERESKWNSDTLLSESLSSYQRILRWDRRERKDVGAETHKKPVELLSARLFWSNIGEKGINLKKSQVEKLPVKEWLNLKLK